ncbi:MAG TPA: histidine kinase [Candidatus Solibacter sp.]|nr:histidine kinase [Candidatus Solibacter sp.]
MLTGEMWRRWAVQFAVAFAAWTVLSIIYAAQQQRLTWISEDRNVPLWNVLWPAFKTYWICALLTPAAIEWTQRVELCGRRWARFALAHLAGFLAFVAAHAALRVLFFSVINPRTSIPVPRSLILVWRMAFLYFNDDIFIYFPLVGGTLAYTLFTQSRRREVEQARLEAKLAGAELAMLKMQLQPHFLFNTLQAISTLVGRDPTAAKRTIALLGDLLRAVLDRAGEELVPLRDELELLDRYVQIELTRFGDKLLVELDIDPNALDCAVPSMILQPLVENAIHHGARSAHGRGEVRIKAGAYQGRLWLTIEDNGPGWQKDPSGGVGLENTRARLTRTYGVNQKMLLEHREEGGARIRLELPGR